jgi:hypothetical protein
LIPYGARFTRDIFSKRYETLVLTVREDNYGDIFRGQGGVARKERKKMGERRRCFFFSENVWFEYSDGKEFVPIFKR